MGDLQGELQREEVELGVPELSIASDSTVKGCQPRRTGCPKDPALQLGTQDAGLSCAASCCASTNQSGTFMSRVHTVLSILSTVPYTCTRRSLRVACFPRAWAKICNHHLLMYEYKLLRCVQLRHIAFTSPTFLRP